MTDPRDEEEMGRTKRIMERLVNTPPKPHEPKGRKETGCGAKDDPKPRPEED